MYLYLFCGCIYAWMRTKLQVGKNHMITKIYYSIEEGRDNQWGKVRCTLFYYIFYLLDMHYYDMDKCKWQVTWLPDKITWWQVSNQCHSVGHIRVLTLVLKRGGGISHHVTSKPVIDPKCILDRLLSLGGPHRGKMKVQGSS